MVNATAFRSASTTDRCVVSWPTGGHSKESGPETEARWGPIVARRRAAYGFDVNLATGIDRLKSGSPRKRARSAKARRIVSAIRCTLAAEPWPAARRSQPSSTFSICTSATPPELGGGIDSTVWPR